MLARRGPRNTLDPWKPYAFLAEEEPGPDGALWDTATVFLTNRECPFRCVMCDLWQNTLTKAVPAGAIPAQIDHALAELPPALWGRPRQLKLYNAGSFFDPRAIPPADYPAIALRCAGFQRVVVEAHPLFVGRHCREWQEHLRREAPAAQLEVAMGLETAHPEVLARLNKRMTLDDFRDAAQRLRDADIDLRVFILVRPPWLTDAEGLHWARRSLDFAFECGAAACTLIPTRGGNGAMEALAAAGDYAPPSLASVEAALEYGLSWRTGRVFADLWDIERFASCAACGPARVERLRGMNAEQRVPAPVAPCPLCAKGAA